MRILIFVSIAGLACLIAAPSAVAQQPSRESEFTSEQMERLLRDSRDRGRQDEARSSIPLYGFATRPGFKNNRGDVRLHVHVSRTCDPFGLYAKYEHETFVTEDGARRTVRVLVFYSDISNDRKDITCNDSELCVRTEQEYRYGCRRSCVRGVATDYDGNHWGTAWACVD
jgi:hypothetical protein